MSHGRMAALPVICLLLGAAIGFGVPHQDRLLILDVGQGDCAVLESQGVTILIDDGPGGRPNDGGAKEVRPALRRNGITHVDMVLLSHPDSDHVGGTPEILREFPGAKIAISQYFSAQSKMLDDLRGWGVPSRAVCWLPKGCEIEFGKCHLRVVCPPVGDQDNDNWGSMFVQVNDDGATADFSGDAPVQVEQWVARSSGWAADLLHAGHHGSKTATGAAWLNAVSPKVAVISCGRNNPYGHPHRSVIERLRKLNLVISRTDLEGDLQFEPKDGHFQRIP